MPPVQGARLEVVPGFVTCVATDAFDVACGDVDGAAGYLADPVTSRRSGIMTPPKRQTAKARQVMSPDGATKDIPSQIDPMNPRLCVDED